MVSNQLKINKGQLRTLYSNRLSERCDNCAETANGFAFLLDRLVRDILGEGGLAAFCPFRKEPDIRPFLRRFLADGRMVFLPRFCRERACYELVKISSLETDVAPGTYGILEPIPSLIGMQPPFHAPLQQVWLVPGIAFDRSGNRLGRGKGFYDRLLEGADGVKIGVAYDCQIADSIPSDIHDVSMDYVVTESQIIVSRQTH